METKIPEWFLSFYEGLLAAQLRALRQLKSPGPKKVKAPEVKSMSNMGMALDILRRAQRPLHISEIIAQVKSKYGVELDRESLVSALVKRVHRHQELSRTAPNTFGIEVP
jgi:phosphoenolpyruvate-protein kinase (PTS system EI component)